MRHGVRLGVDVGQARVGLASSDPAGMLATPVQTLTRDLAHDRDVDAIVEEARRREVIEIVVGLPKSLDGQEGPAAQRARAYAQTLRGRFGASALVVRLVDERLSTVDAHRAMRDSGRAEREHKQSIDQVAAVLFLQAALDAERGTGGLIGEVVGGRKPRHRKSSAYSGGDQT